MPIEFTLSGTDVRVVSDLQTKLETLGPALAEKMTFMMRRLQVKAQANAPNLAVRESIRNPRAEIVGSKVIGHLDVGGQPSTISYRGGKPYDLFQVFEKGAKPHAINPLTEKGTRLHEKGAKRRTGKDVLRFMMGGKEVFARYAFHPGIQGSHFMEHAIQEMRVEFAESLLQTIRDVMRSR